MKPRIFSSFAVVGFVTFTLVGGCGGDDEASTAGTGARNTGGTTGSPEETGKFCEAPSDCYPGVGGGASVMGEAECIDKVEDGYCTHTCETDDDCCAVDGECKTGIKQVCSSFENANVKYCFLSCEDEDLVPAGGAGNAAGAGAVDANEYCEREAHPRFGCRSTGGGDQNRKVCLPTGDTGAGGAPALVGTGGAH
jgi:hypothetical protein